MMELSNLETRKLMPPYLQADIENKVFCMLADEVFIKCYERVDYVQTMGDVKNLPESVLDNLSWELNVDFYDLSLPLEKKQGLIENAVKFQTLKGTTRAVEDMLSVVFDTSEIIEWPEFDGTPGTFKVKTRDYVDLPKYSKIKRVIDVVKNNSSHLDSFILDRQVDIALEGISFVHTAKKIIIEPG